MGKGRLEILEMEESKWNGLVMGKDWDMLGGKPQKSKFRISSKELACKLMRIHKSFSRRNLDIQ